MISVSFIRTVFVSFMVGILLASHVQGQDLPDPRVDLNVRNTPLRDVLHLLELKTNFTFSYLNKELHLNASVTLNVKDTPLQQILEILSKRYALTFTTIKNIITVKENKDVDEENNPQGFGMLRGIVRDSVTSEVLPYASVYIREINSGASTDSRGFFVIPSIPTKKEYTIIVTYVGYSSKVAIARIWENEITEIDVSLAKHAIEMESVNVYGERAKVEEVSVEKLAVQDIENMTHGVETDVMRSIQLEPGVQSTGDVSARYYVRGGASNENLGPVEWSAYLQSFSCRGNLQCHRSRHDQQR